MSPFTTSKAHQKAQEDASALAEPATSDSTADASVYFPPITGSTDSRLSIPFLARFPLAVSFGLFYGFALGASKGGAQAAYRYRAENAHRFPTTKSGWYLYHKSKNYHTIIGSVKEGLRWGGRLSGWATLFIVSEEMIDQLRGRGSDKNRDVASTVCAGMATAGIYNWKHRMDFFTSARMAKTALKVSLVYGLSQDLLSTLRGRRPAYVDWLMRHVWGQPGTVEA